MRLDKLTGLAAALVVVLSGASSASAQYAPPPPPGYGQPAPYGYYPPPPPPPGIQREGLALGGTIGAGSVGFDADETPGVDDSYGGLGLGIHIGASLNQQTQILLDLWGTFFDNGYEQQVAHNVVTVNLRYFPMPKLWVQLGLGFSYFEITDRYEGVVGTSENGSVLLGGIGFDLMQGWSYSIDLGARIALSNYEENPNVTTGAVLLGFNWY